MSLGNDTRPVNAEGTDDDFAKRLDEDFAPAWIPENPGDRIVGVLLRYDEGPSAYGPQKIAVLDTDEGPLAVWLFAAALKQKFGQLGPRPGERIAIKFEGERKSASTGFRYKSFRVAVDRAEEQTAPDFDAWAGSEPGEEAE
jgi:hypothetical protein